MAKQDLECSFCGRKKPETNILIAGLDAHICDRCIQQANGIVLEEVEVRAGDAFNADFAEAITQIPAPNDKLKGKIVDVIEKGYKLGDKIIRFPKVVIGQ